MQYLDERMDVVANNLANVNTNGFKRSDIAFNQRMSAEQAKHRDQIKIDPLPVGETKTYIEYTQGPIQQTSNPLNFALDGSGFFTIQTPNGTAYTRDGAFTMNEHGYLTTIDGYFVMGNRGPIQVEGKSFSVSEDGQIVVDNFVMNQLTIQNFNITDLIQDGNNLYLPRHEFIANTETTAVVRQGFIEASNVNIVKEMIAMIAINRQYQANEKAIKTADEALNKSVNQIAR
jgi:flagellar basal-body rod protein FlgG